MIDFRTQFECVKRNYPSLSVKLDKDGYVLTGTVILNSEFGNIPLYDEYCLEIRIRFDFPSSIPIVRDLNGDVPKGLEHFNAGGELCLGASCDLCEYLEAHTNIVDFINDIIMSYLYTASYYKRYGSTPFGERSHGIKGMEEAYMERYGAKDRGTLISLLAYVAGLREYRGHLLCPCGSGKKLRSCHGHAVLEDIQSHHSNAYRIDAYYLISNYIRERKKEKVKERNGTFDSTKK